MQTLAELVERLGPLRVRDAIGWTLRAALSVWELHRAGRVHGRLSPEAVEIELADCASDGVLRWAAQLDDAPAYHCVERGPDGRPSKEDDVWALGVLLYYLLTGEHPYPGGAHSAIEEELLRPATPIAVHNGDLDVMQPVVDRLIHPTDRARLIEEVVAGLQHFSPAIADLPPLMVEAPTTSMPPPQARFPHDDGPDSSAPVDRRSRLVVAALVALGATVVAGAVALRRGGESKAPVSPTRSATAVPAATPTHVPTAAPDPTPRPASTDAAGGTEDLTACMTPYFPKGSFSRPLKRRFPCRELDANEVERAIKLALSDGGGGELTAAARQWSQLGWYRLAAMTLLRSRCCESAPPLSTPPLLRTCELDPALAALAVAEGDDALARALDAYNEATRCAHAAGGGALLGLEGPPTKAQGARFIRMLTQARSHAQPRP